MRGDVICDSFIVSACVDYGPSLQERGHSTLMNRFRFLARYLGKIRLAPPPFPGSGGLASSLNCYVNPFHLMDHSSRTHIILPISKLY